MSIKRLKPSSEQELIAQIREGLSGYEEEYAPGAWENFQGKKKKKRGLVFWMASLSGAAALLLLGFGIFFFVQKEDVLPVDMLHAVNSQKRPGVIKEEPIDTDSRNNENSILENTMRGNDVVTDKVKHEYQAMLNTGDAQTKLEAIAPEISIPGDFVESALPAAKNLENENKVAVVEENKGAVQQQSKKTTTLTLDEFLARENKLNTANPSESGKGVAVDKWGLGLMVSPSIGNSRKLNMGYGMSMAYHVSEKVSLGSGISYNEMDALKEITSFADNSPSSSAFVNESKSLAEVSTHVTGIDIPLEVNYKLSKRFYVNAGVSAFAVISQKQSNTYQQSRVVQRTAISLSGDSQSQSFLLTEKVTEDAGPNRGTTNNVIGFYNFSLGYRQKLSKDKAIGIEPFIKIPMKDISKENLNLMGTGLKIRFDF